MRALSAALIFILAPLSGAAQGTSYPIDPQQSKLEIHVGKEGAFKSFGHDHLIAAKHVPVRCSSIRRRSTNPPCVCRFPPNLSP